MVQPMAPARASETTADGETDLAVVGAGILGLAVARELQTRRPDLNVTVLEREPAIATHQTSHNSGVLHAGIYYAPGSLKARLCVVGAAAMTELCERHEVRLERCGKVIVARDASELSALDELERRGRANGVAGLRRLDAAQIESSSPTVAASRACTRRRPRSWTSRPSPGPWRTSCARSARRS